MADKIRQGETTTPADSAPGATPAPAPNVDYNALADQIRNGQPAAPQQPQPTPPTRPLKEQVTSTINYENPYWVAGYTTPAGQRPPLPVELGGPAPAWDPNESAWTNFFVRHASSGEPLTDKLIGVPRSGMENVQHGFERTFSAGQPTPGTTTGREVVGGLTQMAGGAAQLTAPIALPIAAVTAPIPTAAALVGGTAAGWGATKVGEAMHLAPEYTEGLSMLANIVAGSASAGLFDAVLPYLKIGPGALSDIQAAALQYARDKGISGSAALQTATDWVRRLQQRTANTPTAFQSQAATEAGLAREAQNLSGAPTSPYEAGTGVLTGVQKAMPTLPAAPGTAATPETGGQGVLTGLNQAKPAPPPAGAPVIPEVAGAGVETGLENAQTQYGTAASKRYTDLEQMEAANAKPIQVGMRKVPFVDSSGHQLVDFDGKPLFQTEPITETIGFPVDLTNAKAQLTPLRDMLQQQMPLTQRQSSVGLQALNNLLDRPDIVPASVADTDLGAIKSILREPGVSDKTKFLLKQTVDQLSPAIDNAITQGGADAVQALAEGRALTKAKYATRATAEQLPDEPVGIYNLMTSPGDVKVNLLRDIQTHAPDAMPVIGRAYYQGMLETAQTDLGAAIRSWDRMGDATKGMLFTPEQISNGNQWFGQLRPIQATLDALGTEPVKIFNKLSAARDANVNLLRQVQTQVPQSVPAIANAWYQGMLDTAETSLAAARRGWTNLGDATKGIFFQPDLVQRTNQFFDVAEPIQRVLGKLGTEPVKLYETLTKPRDVNIELLRGVQTHAPAALPVLGDSVVQGLMEQDPAAALNTFQQMGDGTKQILFGSPQRIADVGNHLQLRVMQGAVPQAGTAPVPAKGGNWMWSLAKRLIPEAVFGAATRDLGTVAKVAAGHALIRGAIGGYRLGARQMARMLWNPRTARLLIEGYRPPRTPLGAAAIGAGVAASNQNAPPAYAGGGYLKNLERRTIDRRAVLHRLTQARSGG